MPLLAEIEHNGQKYKHLKSESIPLRVQAWCRECGEPFVWIEVYEQMEPEEFSYYDGASVVRLGQPEVLLYILPCGHNSFVATAHGSSCCMEMCP